jgi:hypothetical protein
VREGGDKGGERVRGHSERKGEMERTEGGDRTEAMQYIPCNIVVSDEDINEGILWS